MAVNQLRSWRHYFTFKCCVLTGLILAVINVFLLTTSVGWLFAVPRFLPSLIDDIFHDESNIPLLQTCALRTINESFQDMQTLSNNSALLHEDCQWMYNNNNNNSSTFSSSYYSPRFMGPSPQLGLKGPYRVIYNYIPARCPIDDQGIALTTHATPEYLSHLRHLVKRWCESVSVAVYVPGRDFCDAAASIAYLLQCGEEAGEIQRRVTFHLFYHVDHPPPLGWKSWWPDHIQLNCSEGRPPLLSRSHNLSYPINVARNIARLSARTKYVLACDVEILPNFGLASEFLKMVNTPELKVTRLTRKVFALPLFEVESEEHIPETKDQLLNLYKRNKAVHFHRWICPHCQKFPGLKEWLKYPGRPGKIQPFFLAKREYPFHRWEPIYIGTNRDPLYDERLTWEGKQDKMTQMHELCLKGYTFVVLDRAFLVHSPGIKRMESRAKETWRRPFEQENSRVYDVILREIEERYGYEKSGCRKH